MIKIIVLFLIFVFTFVTSNPVKGVTKEDEADNILRDLMRFGDTGKLWPTTVESIKAQFCNTYSRDIFKVINYMLDKYEHDYSLQTMFRLYANEMMRVIHNICSDEDYIKATLDKFNTLNSKADQLKIHRLRLVAILEKASQPENKIGLAQIVCYVNDSHLKMLEELPTGPAKKATTSFFFELRKALIGLTKSHKLEAESCDLSKVDIKDFKPKYKSIELQLMNAFGSAINQLKIGKSGESTNKSSKDLKDINTPTTTQDIITTPEINKKPETNPISIKIIM